MSNNRRSVLGGDQGGGPKHDTSQPLPTVESDEPIIAWRYWVMMEDYPTLLRSPIRGDVWASPILRADGPPVPVDPFKSSISIGYGIFAMKFRGAVGFEMRKLLYCRSHYINIYGAIGEVELFGTVIEHKHGYRAELVRIKRLIIPLELAKYKHNFEQRYQCNVEVNK